MLSTSGHTHSHRSFSISMPDRSFDRSCWRANRSIRGFVGVLWSSETIRGDPGYC
ncbi:hypothetical protein PVAP13_3KG027800 [Panicum virgatum]|uniref:Uncharacterized protein n=1 Tax=Panicum virgatum TaxID=38727 RepID=A0A8T0UKF5_PANVG|nr:hypothetical protein PVAP13_3KG027800 [Panicum virgatum]